MVIQSLKTSMNKNKKVVEDSIGGGMESEEESEEESEDGTKGAEGSDSDEDGEEG